jgi:hypothetical protein
MDKFYFNECLPEIYDINEFKTCFCNTLISFSEISNKHLSIEKAIITEKIPSKIRIGGFGSLYDVIESIANKDMRNLAFSYFTKYPISKHFQIDDEIANNLLERNYIIKFDETEVDAMNLAIVGINQGYLFTPAIHDKLKEDELIALTEMEDHKICVSNLYGDVSDPDLSIIQQTNNQYIQRAIVKAQLVTQSLFNQLLSLLGNCIYSPGFEREFYKLRTVEQKSIFDEFQKAMRRALVTPLYPDTKIVKDVTPDQTKLCSIYELRVYTPTAIRVYFHETTEKVYLTKIGYKASPDQSSEIRNAQFSLNKMILTS